MKIMSNFKRKKNQEKKSKRRVRHGWSSEGKNKKETILMSEFVYEKLLAQQKDI